MSNFLKGGVYWSTSEKRKIPELMRKTISGNLSNEERSLLASDLKRADSEMKQVIQQILDIDKYVFDGKMTEQEAQRRFGILENVIARQEKEISSLRESNLRQGEDIRDLIALTREQNRTNTIMAQAMLNVTMGLGLGSSETSLSSKPATPNKAHRECNQN